MARTTTTTKSAAPNKAQAEFDKYTKRRQAQATASTGSSSMTLSAAAAAVPLHYGLAFPRQRPHLGGAARRRHGASLLRCAAGPGRARPARRRRSRRSVGGLTEAIVTTLRLGVELLNAALFNSAKILAASPAPMGRPPRRWGIQCVSAARAAASRHAASRTAAAASAATPRGELLLTAEHPHAADAETIGAHLFRHNNRGATGLPLSLSQSSLTASTRSRICPALFLRRRRSWISRSYLYWLGALSSRVPRRVRGK